MRFARCFIFCLATLALEKASFAAGEVESIDIAPVWAGHPVRFALLSHGDIQFVAFYDAQRQMTLGQRKLPERQWKFRKLESKLGWDSHNAVTIALDRDHCLHVSGNMHNVPLVYFRASKALDIESVAPIHGMTGANEKRVTYPVFLKGKDQALVFNYRDGSSGNGSTFYNIYDEQTREWRPLLKGPLFDGKGEMNAYPQTPVKSADGWHHMTWLWRDTPMAETNHDLSYARSRDLVHWETAGGQPLALPLTLRTPATIIDPIPANGGIINGSGKVGFDSQGRTLIAYHKFDSQGNTQLYLSRFENGTWRSHQASQWTYRWNISGGGTIASEITHSAPEIIDGVLQIAIKHPDEGSANWQVDPTTLKLTERVKTSEATLPPHLREVSSTFPEMRINWSNDLGQAADGKEYRLRWETLPANRDRPRKEPWPEPSMLQIIAIPR